MHQVCARRWLPKNDATHKQRLTSCPPHLSAVRVQTDRGEASQCVWPRFNWRNVGAQTLTSRASDSFVLDSRWWDRLGIMDTRVVDLQPAVWQLLVDIHEAFAPAHIADGVILLALHGRRH